MQRAGDPYGPAEGGELTGRGAAVPFRHVLSVAAQAAIPGRRPLGQRYRHRIAYDEADLPPFAGLWTVRRDGPLEVFEAVDDNGEAITVVALLPQAARDPRQRAAFAEAVRYARGAGTDAAVTADPAAARPWAASRPGRIGVEGMLAWYATRRPAAPPPDWPPPAGLGRPPQPGARRPLVPVLLALAAAVAALIGLGALVVAAAWDVSSAVPPPPRAPPTGMSTPPTSTPSPLPTPAAARPTLRDVPLVTVVGPGFDSDDDTYTMAFPGYPFAFRVPASWGCIRATVDGMPDENAWACADEQDPDSGQRLELLIRPCPAGCGPAQQDQLDRAWFDDPEQAVAFDATTRVVEVEEDDEGLYTASMSHYFAEQPGGPPVWQVAAHVESPPDTRGDVQKILSDIRSQTP